MPILNKILKGIVIIAGGIFFMFLVTFFVMLLIASVNHHVSCEKFGESWKCNYMVTRNIMTDNDVLFLNEITNSHQSISDINDKMSARAERPSTNLTHTGMIIQLLTLNNESEQLIHQTQSDYDRINSIVVSPSFFVLKAAYLDYLLDQEEFSIYGYKANDQYLKNNFEKGDSYLKAGQIVSQNRIISNQKFKRELENALNTCDEQMSGDFKIINLAAFGLYGGITWLVFFSRKRNN
jgi:hypothetical protein